MNKQTQENTARNARKPDGDTEQGEQQYNIASSDEYILSDIEKKFLLAAERGDCATVRRMIQENRDNPKEFSIDCVDPLNRSALISAIENENFDLICLLLEEEIKVGDALLHAISEEYVEAVEELLRWEEEHHTEGQLYSWEAVDRSKSNFTPDITPLILAAHRNNYEILKVLLDRGATLPMPHDVKCGCDDCVTSQEADSLRYSQSRINAYRALSASSLIALSSVDPVLTAFELSWELKRLQFVESEFRLEYTEMRKQVQEFSTSLLDHARTSTELEIILNFNHEPTDDIWTPGERQTLERLKLAIKYKQKLFVAHPNVQQLLAAIWYDGLPGFRRKTMFQQLIEVSKLGCMFPVYSMNYIFSPDSEKGKLFQKPFVKFISNSASYAFFLMLLGAASQRVERLALEIIGLPWMIELLEDLKKHERGSLPGPIEFFIILYIISLIFAELQSLYSDGLLEYINDLWNIVDFISNMFYVTWIFTRATAWIIVRRDYWYRGMDPWFPREHWHSFDPMLLSEGAFAAGMIFSFLKLVHIFSINPHLGPLQVSLGRMIIDIIKFFFIYTLVLFAFGCGLNQLLWYYADLEKHKCYHLHPEISDFDEAEKACTVWRRFANLFETSQSLFWASFGLVDLVSFDLAGIKGFTRFWALLMFGSYSVINIIVLLNMLIAMMSNSYQIISERADIEWKFARSQLWMSYFEDGGTLPPPFNMCPTVKILRKTLGREKTRTRSLMKKSLEKAATLYDKVMRLLVRRYVTAEQRKRDDFGITEDDIIEVRQDISSLRFELLDIFNKNNMKVPDIDKKQSAGTKKGKVMERRIMKDFQIGIVEGLTTEMSKDTTKDVFSSIAKVIGKKQSMKKGDKKQDWNAIARKNTLNQNPIGSTSSSLMRRSQRSLRRRIIQEANAGLQMDTEKLVEINPKLGEVTHGTRVAYVKFMSKLDREKQPDEGTSKDQKSEPQKPSLKKPDTSAKPAPGGAAQTQSKPAAPQPGQAPAKPDASQPAAAGKTPAPSAPTSAAPKATPKAPGKDGTDKPSEKAAPAATKPAAPSGGAPADKPSSTTAPDSKGATQPTKTPSDSDKPAQSKSEQQKTTQSSSGAGAGASSAAAPAKPAAGSAPAAGAAPAKKDEKPGAKPADKPKPRSQPGQSKAAAGGERGRSKVTGRMISGWL